MTALVALAVCCNQLSSSTSNLGMDKGTVSMLHTILHTQVVANIHPFHRNGGHDVIASILHCVAGNSGAFSALGHTAAELQQWPVAAAAYERSAELSAAAGDQDEQARDLVLAGKHWLTAVAEARQLRKTAAGKLGRDSGTGSSSNGSEAVSAEVESAAAVEAESTGSAVAVHKQQVGFSGP